jgi:DNA-binding HxlR family transcriptional regulator
MSKVTIRGLHCPVARALEIIGDKWTILILRDLFLDGAKKNQDLQDSLIGISPNILTNRLTKLITHEIVKKTIYSKHPPRYEYQLTRKGESLKPLLLNLKEWGMKYTISI